MCRFSDGNGLVYTLSKDNEKIQGTPNNRAYVKNLCVEKDFYMLHNDKNNLDDSVEKILAKFEDDVPNELFKNIPPDLLFPFQDGGAVLDMRQRILLIDAIAIQIARGKATRKYGLSVVKSYYDIALNELKDKLKDDPNRDIHLAFLRQNREMIKSNALIEGAVIELMKHGHDSLLIDNLQRRNCFLLINTTDIDFITSDEPVLICDAASKEAGIFKCSLDSPWSVVYYPLDPKHLVALYTAEYCGGIRSNTCNAIVLGNNDKKFISDFNWLQYQQCHRCVIANKKESLDSISYRILSPSV